MSGFVAGLKGACRTAQCVQGAIRAVHGSVVFGHFRHAVLRFFIYGDDE